MEKEMITTLVGAGTGLVSGAVAAWVTIKAKRLDRVLEEVKLRVSIYDTKLLEERLIEYRKLWRLLRQTSRRQIAVLTFQQAKQLADAMTDWYYDEGGIMLSEDARNKFFSARIVLEPPERDNLGEDWHTTVVHRFSLLRKALSEDLNARRGPTLRSGEE
jgi:hypothetical protein